MELRCQRTRQNLEDPLLPFTEESPLQPNGLYASSKAATDLHIQAYHHNYDLPVVITHAATTTALTNFLRNSCRYSSPMPWRTDCCRCMATVKTSRDWIHAEDHTHALLLVPEEGSPVEIYDISSGHEQTNERMTEWILDILNKPRTLIRYVKDRPGHDRRYALDATKIQNKLSWQPSSTLEGGLEDTIARYRSHRGWWDRIKTGECSDYYMQWDGKCLEESLGEDGFQTSAAR